MAEDLKWDLSKVKKGLTSNPPYISEHLQWLTEKGQELYSKRKDNASAFKKEEASIKMSLHAMSEKLPNNIILVDLGAGLSTKTVTMLECLLRDKPARKISYIPVDVSKIILSWREYLLNNHPDINDRVVHIKPMIGDMLEVVQKADLLLKDTFYEENGDCYVLFSLFGPFSTILDNSYFQDLVKAIGNINGSKGFVFTYVPAHENIEKMVITEYLKEVDMTAMMKCVFMGLNMVAKCNVNPDKFDYKIHFIDNNVTKGIDGNWSGFAIHAYAKEDIQFLCKKLDVKVSLNKGDHIRLSTDIVKSHYYEDKYIRSLSDRNMLTVQGIWKEPSDFISCAFIGDSK